MKPVDTAMYLDINPYIAFSVFEKFYFKKVLKDILNYTILAGIKKPKKNSIYGRKDYESPVYRLFWKVKETSPLFHSPYY